jgi:enamine deaminase RidA (YjgF/YER057c/UK114 family)
MVNPEGLPQPAGFAHAVEASPGRVLYVAGQTGHRGDGSIDDGLVDQFRQAVANVAACLNEAGFAPDSLVRLHIYTTVVEQYRLSLGPIGEAYRQVFGHHYPAMALFGVSELFDRAAKVELVATAVAEAD